MVGYLKVLQGVWSKAGKVIEKIKDRKTAKVDKRIADAVADKERIGKFGNAGIGGSAIKDSSRSLVSEAGGGAEMVTKAENGGSITVGGKGTNQNMFLIIGGVILAALFFFKKK